MIGGGDGRMVTAGGGDTWRRRCLVALRALVTRGVVLRVAKPTALRLAMKMMMMMVTVAIEADDGYRE